MHNLFFSYAHEDESLRDLLEVHLTSLKREGILTTWHDSGSLLVNHWITQSARIWKTQTLFFC